MVAGPAGNTGSGDEIYKSLPNNCLERWYRDPGLRRLNMGIFLTFASATANGFDASLMNGREYFSQNQDFIVKLLTFLSTRHPAIHN